MQLTEVTDKKLAKDFLQVAVNIYCNDPNWIQPLNKDIDNVFDKEKNKAYRFGETIRWVLKDDAGNLIGRVAAFINKKYKSKGDEGPVGGIGFFECINNQDAANLLLNCCKQWLMRHGMIAMDGPINFGERDKWWGMVSEGFTGPLYCMNYNLPYYNQLFTNYGFKVFFNQVCFGFDPKKPLVEKFWNRHDALEKQGGFSSSMIEKNNFEKYAQDFATVYNKAWAGHGGLKEMSKEQVLILFNTMKRVMDERIIWFIYYKDEPIGIFVNLPDLNFWFKHLKGKFNIFSMLKFLWLKNTKPNNKFTGLVFGIVPEWQGKGADAYMICEAAKVIQSDKCSYTQYEMQWIGDFNPKMLNIAENIGETFKSKNLITYRYLFDRTKEFKRHPIF